MLEHITRRNNREGFLADPMTMYSVDYIFKESFSMSMFHKLVFGEYNIDLDYIYDKCEESNTRFDITLRKLSDLLYENSSPFVKNKLIYKYFHELGLELRDLGYKVSDFLKEISNINESSIENLSSTQLTNRIKNENKTILDRYGYGELTDEYMNTPDFKLLRIIDDFLFNHLEIYHKIKGDLTETFNNVIKNTYRKRLAKSKDIFRTFLSSTEENYTNNFNQISTTSTAHTYNLISTPTTSTSTQMYRTYLRSNRSNGGVQSVQYNTDLGNLINDQPYHSSIKLKSKPEVINKKTPGVKILNKSLKIIRKFFSARDLDEFLKCIEITVPGERFIWGFKLRNRKDLITYSKSMSNFSISYDLNIYTKSGEKIARSCIVYKHSPILDQVLSTYLLLKAGKEDEILINSGFFDKDEVLFPKLMEPLIKSLKEKDFDKKSEIDRNLIDDTLDGSGRFQNLRRNRYFQHISSQVEIKNNITNWIKDYLILKGFDRTLYEYTTNLDVSFGEAVDYEAFNLFNINVFDHLVKPLIWKKDLFRYKNRILLDVDVKENIIKNFTPVSRLRVNI